MLAARAARREGRHRRAYEVVRLDTFAVVRQAGDPAILGPIERWQDPAWKAATPGIR